MEGQSCEDQRVPLLNEENCNTMETTNRSAGENCTDGGERTSRSPIHESESPMKIHWYDNPYQVIAMISNYSTSYNVVNVSLVLPILEQLHPTTTSEDAAACASSLLAGMVIGQLLGGALGDSFLGRLGALKLVMALQITASLVSASLFATSGDIYIKLAFCRFLLGVGAGGVYPLAAVLSAEQANSEAAPDSLPRDGNNQAQRVVLTFSTQGLGFVTVPLVGVALLHVVNDLGLIWRLLLGLGSVPGIVLMFLQWKLVHQSRRGEAVPLDEPVTEMIGDGESTTDIPRDFEDLEERHEDSTEAPVAQDTFHDEVVPSNQSSWFQSLRSEPGLVRKVIGTAGTWCLFDVLFYGNTLFQPIVVEAAFGETKSENPIHLLQKTALDSLILTSIALPGYAIAGAIIGKRTFCVTQTPRYVMLQGFAAMSILYFTIGVNWRYLRHYPALLVTLYGMTFFFANYGPNTTTFILPSLLYSPECRTTWNGISAASGKLGALVGATLFEPAAQSWGDANVMLICAGVSIFAFFITLIFVPDTQSSQLSLDVSPHHTRNDDMEAS